MRKGDRGGGALKRSRGRGGRAEKDGMRELEEEEEGSRGVIKKEGRIVK